MQAVDGAIPSKVVPGDRWAIIIAIDQYGEQFRPAAVEGVARELADTLQSGYGYDRSRIITMLGSEATGGRILGLRTDLGKRVKRGDTVIVVALTEWHTLPSGGTALVPANGSTSQSWTLISLEDIRDTVASIQAASTVVLLDRCVRTDANSIVAQSQSKGSYFAGSRSPALIVSGCDRSAGQRGGFINRVHNTLKEWTPRQPGATSSVLSIRELLGRVTSTRALVDVESLDLGGGEITLAFARSDSNIDPTTEASVLNRNSDVEKRLDALGSLIDTVALESPGSTRAVRAGALLEQLLSARDEHELLRGAAARYLGRLKYTRAAPLLSAVVEDEGAPISVRVAALESLVPLDAERAKQTIARGLVSPSAEVRTASITQSISVPGGIETDLLLQRLAVEEADAPLAALVLVIAGMKETPPAAIPPLLKLIESPRGERARREAIRLVGRLGLESAYGPLSAVLANGSESLAVRQDAAYALGKLRYGGEPARQRAAEQLVRAVDSTKDPGVRRGVADSLGRLRVAPTRRTLDMLARDANATVREVAVRALGQFADKGAVGVLQHALRDDSPIVRRAAAQSLGELGDVAAIPALMRAAGTDTDQSVRTASTRALDRLDSGESSSQIQLQLVSSSKDPRAKANAIRALPQRDDQRAIAALIEVLSNDDDLEPRNAAINALGRTPGTEVARQLGQALTSRDDDIRDGAAQALGRLGQYAEPDSQPWQQGLTHLVGHRRDSDGDVRASIARALGSFADPSALNAILPYASDTAFSVRQAAADGLRALGQAYSRRANLKLAIDAGERALKLRQELVGPRDLEVATDYNDLGAYYLLIGDYGNAEENLQGALRIREATLGEKNLNTAVSLANLAALYQRRNEHSQAAQLYKSVLNTRQALLPRADPAVIQVVESLIGLHSTMGDNAEADRYSQLLAELRQPATSAAD